MIYFVRAGAHGPVKIGKAKDVAARIAILATGHYEPLSILATLDAPDAIEAKLHRLLKAHRVNREWFAWCPEVERVVALVKAGRLPEFPVKPRRRSMAKERAKRAAAFVMPDVPPQTMTWLVADMRRRLLALPLSGRHIARASGVDPKTIRNLFAGDDPSVATYDALIMALPALEAESRSNAA